MCPTPVKMDYTHKRWRLYCSPGCARIDKQSQLDQAKQTNLERFGFENAFQNVDVQEKQKQTNIIKYGVSNVSKNPTTILKIKQTKLLNHGNENYNNRDKAIETCLMLYDTEHYTNTEKAKQTNIEKYGVGSFPHREDARLTMIEKYGVEYSGQSKELMNKRIETCLEKYGTINPRKSPIVKLKIKQTNLRNHTNVHNSQQHMINIIHLINNPTWVEDQYITQNDTSSQIADKLGTTGTTVLRYIHKYGIKIKPQSKTSNVCTRWLNQLAEQEFITIEREFRIPRTPYSADGYCTDTNTIYEFHGDFYHGNPNRYGPDFLNTKLNKTMGELYQATTERENKIRALGYNLVVLWESDFIKQQRHNL
jgi:hypothetical protein